MESLAVIEERLANLSARTTSNHDAIASVREKQTEQGTKQALQDAAVKELRSDMADLKRSNNRLTAAAIAFALSAVGSAVTIALSTGSHP